MEKQMEMEEDFDGEDNEEDLEFRSPIVTIMKVKRTSTSCRQLP